MNSNKKFKPVVTQLKTGVAVQRTRHPIAPPVYRPQPLPKVLQTKRSLGLSIQAAQTPRPPIAPPVYRPQQSSKAAQPKMTNGAPSRKPPVTPSVYRPQPLSRVMQTKMPGQPLPERKQAPSVRQASAIASTPWQPNGSRNSIQRYLEDVDPDTYWRTIDSTRDTTAAMRASARRWEKAGIEGGPRLAVDRSNTVMSSGVVEFFVRGEKRTVATEPHVSGNPWKDFGAQEKVYSEREMKHYGANERDCAEPKVLKDVDAVLRDTVRREGGIRTLVYLYSEFTPCSVCEGKIRDWLAQHNNVELLIVADQRFTHRPYQSRWRYNQCEGRLYLGWQAHPDDKEERWVRPVASGRRVSSSFSFAQASSPAAAAAAAAGGGGGGGAAVVSGAKGKKT